MRAYFRPHLAKFLKFGVIGGSVALIGAGVLYVLIERFSVEKNLAYLIQAFISLQLNFFLNDQFTWANLKGQNGYLASRWAKFHVAKLLSVALNQVIFTILTAVGVHYLVVYALSVGLIAVVNYYTNDRFVFAPVKQA
jgi:putative flippase GtrA